MSAAGLPCLSVPKVNCACLHVDCTWISFCTWGCRRDGAGDEVADRKAAGGFAAVLPLPPPLSPRDSKSASWAAMRRFRAASSGAAHSIEGSALPNLLRVRNDHDLEKSWCVNP